MEILETLYNLLQINRKIENKFVRYLYLKDVWGMDQITIANCEGVSQSLVSRELIVARAMYSYDDVVKQTANMYTAEEIQYIQFLPREILKDIQCIAFITDLLGITPIHPFYQHYDTAMNYRIAALSSLGVQHKRLQKLFDKSQSNISMVVKRSGKRVIEIEYPNRYDKVADYKFQVKPQVFQFRKAGGQE